MNLVYAAGIASLMGCGLYLILSRQVVRIMLGVMLLSAGINLARLRRRQLRSGADHQTRAAGPRAGDEVDPP